MTRGHGQPESPVTIRPIRATDVDALERFYAELSPDSRAWRFLGATPALGHARSEAFCRADHEHREGFVATVRETDGTEHLVGHLCVEPDAIGSAEIAVAVDDAFRRRGIGRRLVLAAVAWGRQVGLGRLDATAFATNAPIIELLRHLGLPVRIDWHVGPTCDVSLDLTPMAAAA
jgi:acetyltransferase